MKKRLSGKKKILLFCCIWIFSLFLPVTVKAGGIVTECVSDDFNGDLISDNYEPADEFCVFLPTKDNKKGLQGTEYVVSRTINVNGREYVQSADEAPQELGINHVLLNFDIAQMLASDAQTDNVIVYSYNGVEYRFNQQYLFPFLYRVKQYQVQCSTLTDQPVAVSIVILMSKPEDPKYDYLLCPGARNSDSGSLHLYYALNTQEPAARETLSAVFDYLTKAFGDKEHFVQNWILGNELDMPDVYNYSGSRDAAYNACVSAEVFNLFYEKIQDNSPYSKAYISLTNRWNTDSDGKGIGGKNFLTLFSQMVQTNNWNIAFHAYDPTWTSKMWEEKATKYLSYSSDSPYICAANLNYMTDYVKETYGDNHRFILSEQGFNVLDNSMEEQYKQAAELIYTYYAAVRNDMVDAVIFNNWYDCSYQPDLQGIHIGLHDDNGAKREAYYAFKYMDTDPAQIEKYRNYINQACVSFPSWDCNILYAGQPEIVIANPEEDILNVQAEVPWNGLYSNHLYYRWSVVNEQTMETCVLQDWTEDNNTLVWAPEAPAGSGIYTLVCEIMTTDQRLFRAESVYVR